MVDTETHEFVKWSDVVPAYSGTPNDGIPADAFVNTVTTQVNAGFFLPPPFQQIRKQKNPRPQFF